MGNSQSSQSKERSSGGGSSEQKRRKLKQRKQKRSGGVKSSSGPRREEGRKSKAFEGSGYRQHDDSDDELDDEVYLRNYRRRYEDDCDSSCWPGFFCQEPLFPSYEESFSMGDEDEDDEARLVREASEGSRNYRSTTAPTSDNSYSDSSRDRRRHGERRHRDRHRSRESKDKHRHTDKHRSSDQEKDTAQHHHHGDKNESQKERIPQKRGVLHQRSRSWSNQSPLRPERGPTYDFKDSSQSRYSSEMMSSSKNSVPSNLSGDRMTSRSRGMPPRSSSISDSNLAAMLQDPSEEKGDRPLSLQNDCQVRRQSNLVVYHNTPLDADVGGNKRGSCTLTPQDAAALAAKSVAEAKDKKRQSKEVFISRSQSNESSDSQTGLKIHLRTVAAAVTGLGIGSSSASHRVDNVSARSSLKDKLQNSNQLPVSSKLGSFYTLSHTKSIHRTESDLSESADADAMSRFAANAKKLRAKRHGSSEETNQQTESNLTAKAAATAVLAAQKLHRKAQANHNQHVLHEGSDEEEEEFDAPPAPSLSKQGLTFSVKLDCEYFSSDEETQEEYADSMKMDQSESTGKHKAVSSDASADYDNTYFDPRTLLKKDPSVFFCKNRTEAQEQSVKSIRQQQWSEFKAQLRCHRGLGHRIHSQARHLRDAALASMSHDHGSKREGTQSYSEFDGLDGRRLMTMDLLKVRTSECVTKQSALELKRSALKKPDVLLGWKVFIYNEKGAVVGAAVITGLKTSFISGNKYRISSFDCEDLWLRLKLSKASTHHQEYAFQPVRQVLQL